MNRLASFLAVISISMAACRPVFAIGYGEILILTTLIVILLGPLILRIYRTWQKHNSDNKEEKDRKK